PHAAAGDRDLPQRGLRVDLRQRALGDAGAVGPAEPRPVRRGGQRECECECEERQEEESRHRRRLGGVWWWVSRSGTGTAGRFWAIIADVCADATVSVAVRTRERYSPRCDGGFYWLLLAAGVSGRPN